MDDTPPSGSDDDHDDLAAALDFSPPVRSDTSDLDALGGYVVGGDGVSDDELPVPVFSVTNPPGTVTVTTFMDGRVQQIDLSPKVTTLTESMLAEEIVVVARLATQDARAAQYSFMLEGMRQQGHDDVATRDFLERDLDLPSPEQAIAARAAVFAERYGGDHE
ncbi:MULTISPECIES: YbaB/EbfC family DNA-binding protein [unclassified Mycobacterium]|uniref:YbaB/EbfC family DNA-binding protein n=1 Tax=unclassified Mycobacterium TaxID=2642494 RepID=UPI0029C83B13|nr:MULTISPECIES: YbaB/EbfC family DNA-binding protein [unclassified Mycobacterium]